MAGADLVLTLIKLAKLPENIATSNMHKAYQHLRQKIQPVFVSTNVIGMSNATLGFTKGFLKEPRQLGSAVAP